MDINIPQLNDFIHKVYVNVARKLYTNVYLFEQNIMPLNVQRNNRELEMMTKECILGTIRDNIPVEEILKVYMDESIEEDVQVEEKEEIISEEQVIDEPEIPIQSTNSVEESNITFNDVDKAIDVDKNISEIVAPKDVERLETISVENHLRRKEEEQAEDDEDEKIKIGTEINLTDLDIHSVVPAPQSLKKEEVWDEIEILPLE